MSLLRRDIVRDLYKNDKISKELRNEIKKLIRKLKKINGSAFEHSIRVAEKVFDVSKYLNFDNHLTTLITVAALLHDVGKIQIFNLFFNLNDKEDLEKVWRYYYGDKRPEKNYSEILTVKQIIEFYSNNNSQEIILERFNEFWSRNGYTKEQYETLTMMDYIHLHQNKTKNLLLEIKLPYSIVIFAATHHSSYYKNRVQKTFIPIEARIIEICDKYDALIESKRKYRKKRTSFEAITTIIDELNDEMFLFNKTSNQKIEEDKRIIVRVINYFLNFDDILYSFDTYYDTIAILLKSEKIDIETKIKILKRIKTLIRYLLLDSVFETKYKTFYRRVLGKLGKVCEEYADLLK